MKNQIPIAVVVATLSAGGAFAQVATPTDPSTPPPPPPLIKHAEGHLASNLIGETVYNGIGDEAESIGDVNDIVINSDGKVEALVIGVGGFLGIGEKDVAIEYGLAKISMADNFEVLVVETTAEALEAQEDFDSAAYAPMPADVDIKKIEPATAEDLAKAEIENVVEDVAPAASPETLAQ
ncbi:MAG: PRC-barrel domain containing protein [Hyphomicrobiales bacterium]|nr:PRC-barrel domain containing protein [Hyphomicrobiales bacterium]